VLHGLAGGCFASLDIILHEFLVEQGDLRVGVASSLGMWLHAEKAVTGGRM